MVKYDVFLMDPTTKKGKTNKMSSKFTFKNLNMALKKINNGMAYFGEAINSFDEAVWQTKKRKKWFVFEE